MTDPKIIELEMRIKELEQEKKIQQQHIQLLLTSSLPKTKYIEDLNEVFLPHYCLNGHLNGHVPDDTKLLISKIELTDPLVEENVITIDDEEEIAQVQVESGFNPSNLTKANLEELSQIAANMTDPNIEDGQRMVLEPGEIVTDENGMILMDEALKFKFLKEQQEIARDFDKDANCSKEHQEQPFLNTYYINLSDETLTDQKKRPKEQKKRPLKINNFYFKQNKRPKMNDK